MNATRFNPARLREARGDRSLEVIAAAAGVSRQAVDNRERGKSEPDATPLFRIAEATGRSLDFFFESMAESRA